MTESILEVEIYIMNPPPYLFLRSWIVPKQTNLPLTSIPILLHKYSASSIEWVVRMIELDFFYKLSLRVFHRNLLAMGSRPVLGSSKKRRLDPPMSALLTHNLRLFPPLRFLDGILI